MVKNALLGTTGIILLAGSLLLLWFVILSGVTHVTPLRHIYFLRADTSGITGSRSVTQWTYFYFCGPDNRGCGPPRPAPAFGKAWASKARNVPAALFGSHGGHTTSSYYYYMWRFGWVFILITLFFLTLAFFASLLACCGRLGAAISSVAAFTALFFHTIGTSLMTATFVRARNVFHRDGRSAKVGTYAFGFMWASWAALLLATLLFCIGIRTAKKRRDSTSTSQGYTGRGFRRKRSVRRRSRSMEGRRVKEEYS